ncbi:MAG: cytidine deaminase [Anaerotignaceae bacterium]
MENRELISLAKQAMQNAYAPYSHFKVGAAAVGKSGVIYTGCNIENSSYGATNCAERTAMFKGISEGEREFEKIAIVSTSQDLTFPCGICRQVMVEFMHGGVVILEDKNGELKEFSVEELMPKAFLL